MKAIRDQFSSRRSHFLRNSVAGSFIIAILILIALISFAPDSTPYSPNNYGWNGTRTISTQYSITEINSFSGIPVSSKSTILIIGPAKEISQGDANFLKIFVAGGGELVIADSSGFSNSLLSEMGLGIKISSGVLVDSLYNWKSPEFPIGFATPDASQYRFMDNVSAAAFDSVSPLTITSSSAQALVVSSDQSELVNSSGSSVISGPFPLIAVQTIGNGFVVVIGDSSFFTNSVIVNANNMVLAKGVFSNTKVYLDTSHWPINTAASLRGNLASVYSILSQVPYRYLFVLLIVGSTLLLAPTFIAAFSLRSRPPSELKRTFNKGVLERVREDRKKFGIER
jgi:Domain of unknown function (DUF4350)